MIRARALPSVFEEALVPDSDWHDIQSGPFDGNRSLSFRTKGSRVFRKVSFSVPGVAYQGQEKVFPCWRTEGGVGIYGDHRSWDCQGDQFIAPQLLAMKGF